MKAKSNKFWLGVLATLLVISALGAWLVMTRTGTGTTAVITLDGTEVERIDLARVTQTYTLSCTGKSGITNVVEVQPGAIRVKEADCPDRICVKQGWIRTGVAPLVCLPNALTITIEGGDSGLDGMSK